MDTHKISLAQLRSWQLAELSPNSVIIIDQEGRIVLINRMAEEMYGYDHGELLGRKIELLIPERFRDLHVRHRLEYNSNPRIRPMASGLDIICMRKDGTEFRTEVSLSPMEAEEGFFVISIIRDISERIKIEERLKASLKEKEVLLREVYHRVKNNMQVISSLLNLQSEYIKDKRAIEMCKESQNRIRSMALVHEKLYQSKNLADIDFGGYIKDLVNSLFHFYEDRACKVEVYTRAEDVSLSIDSAIPCGLIINELVSNSIKHAFPEDWKGEKTPEIRTILSRKGQDTYELIVADNGIGIQVDLDLNNVGSLGLKLVNALVKQLQGSLELRREGGTEFRIRFKDIKPIKKVV